MRAIAAFPAVIPAPSKRGWEKEYSFRTITPVFGAGVEARLLDEQTPIRGTSVRGHLRFWWRATRGRVFTDYRKLREAEFAIWGDTENPSEVDVEVLVDNHKAPMAAETFVDAHQDLKYALFPFTSPPPGKYWDQLSFRVRVRCPEKLHTDVEAALWAWANFGGVGSRTRRGCGALFCAEFAPASAQNTTAWMQERFSHYVEAGPNYDPGLREWASLAWPALVNPVRPGPAVDAWKAVIRLLAEYRQLPPVGRRGTLGYPKTYSRSYWPEADSLRAITGQGIPEHMNTLTTTEAFPRAELGLPYMIKFRSGPGRAQDSANDCTVLPLHSSRVASPLILRPIALGPQGATAVPAIVWVASPKLDGVRIEFRGHKKELRGSQYVTDPRFGTYPNSPMGPSGSAVDGFLAFAQEKAKGYKF